MSLAQVLKKYLITFNLKGKRYKLTKQQIIGIILVLFPEENIVFEDLHVVWSALKNYTLA